MCGEYYPKPSANGVCVLRIQEALLKNDIQSDVICVGPKKIVEKSKFGEVIFVPSSNSLVSQNTLKKFWNKVRILTTWPVKDKQIITDYVDAIKMMFSLHPYDAIVSALRPIEGALACSQFEKVLLYELDSITNNGDNLHGIKHALSYRAKKIETILYDNAYRIYHLRCHEYYYSKPEYDKFRNKFEFTDIPHLIHKEKNERTIQDEKTRIIYTGSLTKVRNSPEYAIELLKLCASEIPLQCNFFSRGDCEGILEEAHNRDGDLIIPMGYVSQEELAVADGNTDVYLSIGFHHTGTVTSIPSKIFEYMSTGKPVIHIVGGDNDTAIEYLIKYKNALIINPVDSLQENAKKTVAFINEKKGTLVDVDELRVSLPMNTPEWTAERFVALAIKMGGKKNDN